MTAQVPDKICINGKVSPLLVFPLEQYWKSSGRNSPFWGRWTCCNRGYVAMWAIENNQVFLTAIEAFMDDDAKYDLGTVFTNCEKMFAAWYSEDLVVGDGKELRSPYRFLCERSVVFNVNAGFIVGQSNVKTNSPECLLE